MPFVRIGATAALTAGLLALPLAPALALDATFVLQAQRAEQPFAPADLDNARWQAATKVNGFTNIQTAATAAEKTEATLFYDDRSLYVAFHSAQLSPLTASQRTNDVGFGADDYVGFGIDPSGNGEQAYYFETTPAGTRYQQSTESARYRPVWQSYVTVSSNGWDALLVVPLDALRIRNGKSQTWRLNFVRSVAVSNERYSWAYSQQMDTGGGFPDLVDARWWNKLTGVSLTGAGAHPKPRAEIFALSSSGLDRDTFVTPTGNTFTEKPKTMGLDVAVPVTPTVSFVGALQPDFSNVEVDQLSSTPQIFQRNLTEYRPFFAQGANFINNAATQLAVNGPANTTFYSPSLGPIDRGLKLEGTFGQYQSFGLLEARGVDALTQQTFDDVAFGFKHVLPQRAFGYWTNGVLADHDGVRDDTVEFGAEARNLKSGLVSGFFHDFERGTLVGNTGLAQSTMGFVDRQTPTSEVILGYKDIGPLYNPIDGFTLISDIRGPAFAYNLWGAGPHGLFKRGDVGVFAERYLDRSGALHEADEGVYSDMDLRGTLSLHAGTTNTELRTYDGNTQSGYPLYNNPLNERFSLSYLGAGLRENSRSPLAMQYSWGPYGTFYLHQITSNATAPLGSRYRLGFELDGTRESAYSGASDGQWLRRVSLAWSIDQNSDFSAAWRDVSGNGGFALAGNNISAGYHRRFRSGNELFLNFGTPAANRTIDRFIVKYLLKTGSGSGT